MLCEVKQISKGVITIIRKNKFKLKVSIPKIFNKILPRKKISEILSNATPCAAVYFIAPYGYGKTLSVVSWLQECDTDAVWLTLEPEDNSELSFFAGLSAAMLRFSKGKCDISNILSDSEFNDDPQDFLWDTVSEAEKISSEKILVIDNFNFIRDRELLRSFKAIISELLGRWRIIIMSRTELPAVFIDLILKGQVCLITPKELGFNPEEIKKFFCMNGGSISPQAVLDLSSETEGWPASLNVVNMTSHGDSVAYGEAAKEYVVGFFDTEIWAYMDGSVKTFLLKTSIMDKLTPAACRAVTDIGATLPVLQQLYGNGLFISRLDERESYCYHRVFKDFLLSKLKASDIDEQELNRKLGWWLFDNNEIEKSFPCFFKSGDLYGLSQALRMINPTDIGGIERYLEITGCITSLDISLLKPYPVIVARIALICFLIGDIAQMKSLYQLFYEWSEPDVLSLSPDEYAEFMCEIGWLSFLDPSEPTKENKKHRQWINYEGYKSLPFLDKLQLDRSSVLYLPSMLKGIRDYGDDGLFETEKILNRIEAGEKNLVDKKESQWLSYLLLAEYHYERERFEDAENIVRRIMSKAEENQLTFIYFIGTALLVKIVRAVHNPNEIAALTERLEAMILQNKHTFLLPNFHAFELRNRLIDGHKGFTDVFEKENKDYEDKPYFFLIYRHITFVRGLLSIGSYSRAMLIMGNLELLCKRYNRPTDLAEINILRAIALYGLGYVDNACQHLIEAVEWAERYGFIRLFSDEAKGIWPVLELVRKQITRKYVQNLVISCKKALAKSKYWNDTKKYLHVMLTKTERKVLEAVQSGMSYAEIAEDNGIRMSTVKTHLHSIYSKLEVNNKTAAVIEARKRGILS